MRKTLSILIAAIMMISLVLIGVSAEGEPVAVTTADEFTAMDPAGNYYLANDITVTASFAGDFSGTLDGKNHKVTLVDVPLFKKIVGGTVKNLTLEGTVLGNDDLGALANNANKITVTNVTNNANVTCAETTGGNAWIGGIVGSINTGAGTKTASEVSTFTNVVNNGKIFGQHSDNDARLGGLVGNAAKYQLCVFISCVNNGAIEYTGTKTNAYIAGIIGGSFGAEYTDCVNNGSVTANKASSAGGILGRGTPSSQGGDQSQTFLRCVNNGTISSNGTAAGGIFAYINEVKDGATQTIKVDACINTGAVTNSGSYAGGIGGYVWASETTSHAEVTNCLNTGAISGTGETTWTSQILCYTNSTKTIVNNNIAAGTTTAATEDYDSFIANSKALIADYTIQNNYFLNAPKNFSFNASDENVDSRHAFAEAPAGSAVTVTADQLASGEVAYLANQFAGKEVFFQTLGKDAVPTTLAGHKSVILENNAYANPAEPSNPTTGDATVWFVLAGAVALFGTAVTFKVCKSR